MSSFIDTYCAYINLDFRDQNILLYNFRRPRQMGIGVTDIHVEDIGVRRIDRLLNVAEAKVPGPTSKMKCYPGRKFFNFRLGPFLLTKVVSSVLKMGLYQMFNNTIQPVQ